MRWTYSLLFVLLAAPEVRIDPAALKLFAPLPVAIESPANPITEAKVQLGRMLYYDARFSRNRQISCNTCHPLKKYGADSDRVSTGYKGQKGSRNAPTVYNAAGHLAQFWDGRAADVEQQAKGPVLNPVEMAMPTEQQVLEVIRSRPGYLTAFQAAFPGQDDPVNYDNFGKAIGAFERKLVTPSRWDRFLAGDARALSDQEKAGFNQFLNAGCAGCHMGAYIGGTSYQKLGVAKPWKNSADQGRYAVTHNERDRMMFKVPALRNIARTGPYFHDGSVAKLDQAVLLMAEVQTGRSLSGAQTQSIVTWLGTLTGEIPAGYIQPPALP